MNAQQLKDYREYFSPRTQKEKKVYDLQIQQKLNTMSFMALSAGMFGLAPVAGVGLLGVAAVSGAVYCTCKLFENYKLATENLNLFHAMKKESWIKSENYQQLSEIADVINEKDSTINNILGNIKKLRGIEKNQAESKLKF